MSKFKAGDVVEVVKDTSAVGVNPGALFLVYADDDYEPYILIKKGRRLYVGGEYADDFKLVERDGKPVAVAEPEQEVEAEPITSHDVAAIYAAIAIGAIEASDFDVALEAAKALERLVVG